MCQKKSSRSRYRRGTTVVDLLVAATLLATMITTVMTLTVRGGRLRQQTRQHQLALDELANQLQRLLSLDDDARAASLRELEPSPHLQSSLPGCTLKAETPGDDRLVLSLNWDRPIDSVPVRLTGWTDAAKGSESQP